MCLFQRAGKMCVRQHNVQQMTAVDCMHINSSLLRCIYFVWSGGCTDWTYMACLSARFSLKHVAPGKQAADMESSSTWLEGTSAVSDELDVKFKYDIWFRKATKRVNCFVLGVCQVSPTEATASHEDVVYRSTAPIALHQERTLNSHHSFQGTNTIRSLRMLSGLDCFLDLCNCFGRHGGRARMNITLHNSFFKDRMASVNDGSIAPCWSRSY